ncbi:MAG: D-glycerate dehydrogenase [Promethearchaeati archaeon SRVP18_Atabeyarchaeia-1]
MTKVYSTRKLPGEALNLLEENGIDFTFNPKDEPPSEGVLKREVSEVDGLLCLLTEKITPSVIDAGENLKVIANIAVGYDNIDVKRATEKGIFVTNTPGVLTETTADLAWALLMAAARRIVEADKFLRAGKWKIQWNLMFMTGLDVYSKTLGIMGLGRIGQAVAKRAKGFNMKILYHDEKRNPEAEDELGVQYADMETVLKEADFISIHVPLTEKTRGFISDRQLALMKKTAILINTSRGPVIDESALYRALKQGTISGAGLDVFQKEPIDRDNPLIKLENVVLVPHIGSASTETRTKMAVMAVENAISALRGKAPQNLVNPDVLKLRTPTC